MTISVLVCLILKSKVELAFWQAYFGLFSVRFLFFFFFFPAEVILSYLKPTPNGTLSAPCVSDTTPAQMLSAIVFLTVTRHSITRDPGTFCSPAFGLNENRVCFKKERGKKKKKHLSELISSPFEPWDAEAGTKAHIYEKIRGRERTKWVRKIKIHFPRRYYEQ